MRKEDEYDVKKIFEELEAELIKSMKRNLGRHLAEEKAEGFDWPQWQTLKLKQLKKYQKENKNIFNDGTKEFNRNIYKHIKNQFKEGASRTKKEAINAGFINREDLQLGGSFFGLNHRKLDALIKSTKDDVKDVKYATLRMMNDEYRKTVFKAQLYVNTGAGTIKQAIDMATKDFLAKGINCIEYKDGRRVNIADYCDMVIRTANKRANLMGEGELRKRLGISTVYVSKHGTSCDMCGKWEGRVYIDDVWSGGEAEDGKYPLLSKAIDGGLFHPRCRHGLSTYYEGINDEPKEVTEARHNHDKDDEYIQYLQRKIKQYERLTLGSLSSENIEKYKNRVDELKNRLENDTIMRKSEQKILDVYKNWDGKNLKVLATDMLDTEEIPVFNQVLSSGNHAECPLIIAENGEITILSMKLNQLDNRDKKYKIKTILHELFHVKSNKLLSDIKEIGTTEWKSIEEIFAECSAHYYAKMLGITDMAPSYANFLAHGLPKLKKLEDFKNCNNIYDFGKITSRYRFGKNKNAKWKNIYEHLNNINMNYNEYYGNYIDYIEKNKENIILKYLENQQPQFVKYKSNMLQDLESAISRVKDGKEPEGKNQIDIFSHGLLYAMNKKGVL